MQQFRHSETTIILSLSNLLNVSNFYNFLGLNYNKTHNNMNL